jgi:aspartyl-tRNA(Asn)/glutamyl-tRNA(Gln) amidotransferase subunit A
MDLLKSSFSEITAAIKKKNVSAEEVTRFFISRIERLNDQTNAYTEINAKAVEQARAIDKKIHAGDPTGDLAGIPFGIKEMFCTQGLKTTACSKMLENFRPPYTATAVKRLQEQGAIILGKLNQDEFAMGSSNENSIFGHCKNPWNTEHVPGGSSGGSAAAQAARMAAGTLGTDTGGSIRQPASFCGVVGVKPTYSRISRYGIIAFASSLDQAGPIVSSVEDAALSLQVMSGFDENDGTTSRQNVPRWMDHLNKNVKGKKVAVVREYSTGKLNPDVEKTFQQALQTLKNEGAEIVEVSIPLSKYAVPIYYLVSASEASSNLSRYDGVRYGYRADFKDLGGLDIDEFYMRTRGEGFGPEVKRRIMLGTFCLSSGYFDAYYRKACQVRRLLQQQIFDVFQQADVIVSPVTTSPAFKIGEKIFNPVEMYYNDIFTVSANLAGIPSMSVPFGRSQNNLPIGIQVWANQFNEQAMLNFGYCLQENSSETKKVALV